MSRIVWKENKLVSIEVGENIYVLAQLHIRPYLIVFNLFREDDEWEGVAPNEKDILCCKSVTKQFMQSSNVTKKDLPPILNYKAPNLWIKRNTDGFKLKLWEGTSDEIELMLHGKGGGKLIEENIYEQSEYPLKVIKSSVPLSEIDNYETTSIEVFPGFNERLYLCYKLGKNVDPEKDLIFERPIPDEYKRFCKIIKSEIKDVRRKN